IRRYSLWGGAKRIRYADIHQLTRLPLSEAGGRGRIWGSGDLVHWWNLDAGRMRKEVALLIDVGKRFIPSITPDDPDTVERILRDHIG
ncbi:MAG: hypothetical protein JST73_10425, partial [Actinobacteria bacterium]|nr:hypothetical protein [Actinomycetota bacterium]